MTTSGVRPMLLALMLSLAAAPGSTASAEPAVHAATNCGTIPGAVALYEVTATGVGCRAARAIARRWRSNVLEGRCERFDCRVRAYRCRARQPARISYTVRCASAERRIRFAISVD
jgi:hypothetical protein